VREEKGYEVLKRKDLKLKTTEQVEAVLASLLSVPSDAEEYRAALETIKFQNQSNRSNSECNSKSWRGPRSRLSRRKTHRLWMDELSKLSKATSSTPEPPRTARR
jgi:hypothetical protein